MTEKEKQQRAEINKRFYERQNKRGFVRINTYVEPETKRQLKALAKKEGSLDAALQKLLKHAQEHPQAA